MGERPDTASGGTKGNRRRKSFEQLFAELQQRKRDRPAGSKTVEELDKGIPFIVSKTHEEVSEAWKAWDKNETKEQLALEISQAIYHLEVMMVAHDLELDDIYEFL